MLPTLTIRDAASGSSAEILPGLGFNCFRFQTQTPAGSVEWLWFDPEFTTGTTRPSRSGIPILFPHPGRIAGAAFEWEGKRYALEPTDGLGNAIHGFVHTRPWRVVKQEQARVVGQFQPSIDDPAILQQWPADFRLSAEYTIAGSTLRLRFTVENPSLSTLPFSLGAHPYFRVPQVGPSADACIVKMPITERWQVENLLPTGKKLPLDDAAAYQTGRAFGQLQLDDPFSGLMKSGDHYEASVEDPAAGSRLTIRWGDEFREIVAFTPPTRAAICIEPYTAVPDAIHLQQRGVDAGLRVLRPGETFEAAIEFVAAHP